MPSPFPGMDPFLEVPELWSEVHSRLIVAIADRISEQLSDDYRVAIEKRTYFSGGEAAVMVGIPDVSVITQKGITQKGITQKDGPAAQQAAATAVMPKMVTMPLAEEVQERYLEIRDVSSGAVVTALELLSPKNKRSGEERRAYERKRYQVLASLTHLVEIDLLRGGKPLPIHGVERQGCYSILVSRGDLRPRAELYEFGLQQPIPPFALPLKEDDESIAVELQPLLKGVYKRAKYHLAIDYSQSIKPAFSAEELVWIKQNIELPAESQQLQPIKVS